MGAVVHLEKMWPVPTFGVIELDYVSPRRPAVDTPPISDEDLDMLLTDTLGLGAWHKGKPLSSFDIHPDRRAEVKKTAVAAFLGGSKGFGKNKTKKKRTRMTAIAESGNGNGGDGEGSKTASSTDATGKRESAARLIQNWVQEGFVPRWRTVEINMQEEGKKVEGVEKVIGESGKEGKNGASIDPASPRDSAVRTIQNWVRSGFQIDAAGASASTKEGNGETKEKKEKNPASSMASAGAVGGAEEGGGSEKVGAGAAGTTKKGARRRSSIMQSMDSARRQTIIGELRELGKTSMFRRIYENALFPLRERCSRRWLSVAQCIRIYECFPPSSEAPGVRVEVIAALFSRITDLNNFDLIMDRYRDKDEGRETNRETNDDCGLTAVGFRLIYPICVSSGRCSLFFSPFSSG